MDNLKKGLYEQLLSDILQHKLKNLDEKFGYEQEKLDYEESSSELSRYIQKVLKTGLEQFKGKKKVRQNAQLNLCNDIIKLIAKQTEDAEFENFLISDPAQKLLAIYEKIQYQGKDNAHIPRPESPINQSSLFTGTSTIEPSLVSEWKKEIKTSNQIDLLVAFIRWSGVRQIIKELEDFTQQPNNKLRIITTTYTGATQSKAIEELAKLKNTEIKISYDTNRTRLHAKAYIFQRHSGFGTAYIGSSNLSRAAINTGLEWNMKVSEYENKDVFEKCVGTFDSYWNDPEFIPFDIEEKEKLRVAIKTAQFFSAAPTTDSSQQMFQFDIIPYTFQKQILDELEAERKIYGRYKNLIVAATGTGKTVVSAFDYKRFREETPQEKNRLLFIAHRQEILEQSRDCFRRVLKDQNFGDLWVGQHRPAQGHGDHLFISIQSFNSQSIENLVDPDYFDYIIIDEFHHAAADSYQIILDYFTPEVLLGLTATPERMDGKSIIEAYFDGYIAAEIRLREAINRELLSPFQYYMVSDATDLSHLAWSRGGYKISDLEELYVRDKENNIRRAEIIRTSVLDYVADIKNVKGIGFCVSQAHAHFMADYFDTHGIPSLALDSKTPNDVRQSAKRQLNSKRIHFIFVVDLYNEGVDIPDVNTVLFLRPTQSLTIFLQQLGRGLRLSEGKDYLLVLDFVGQAHQNYRFADKFRALLGKTRHSLKKEIKNGFPSVPRGCYIELEKQAQEHILDNIKQSINNVKNIRRKIKQFPKITNLSLTLKNFLNYYGIEIGWLYKASDAKNKGWNRLCVQVGLRDEFKDSNPDEEDIVKGIQKLTLSNSRRFLQFIKDLFENIERIDARDFTKEEALMLSMFHYTMWNNSPQEERFHTYIAGVKKINRNPVMKQELLDVVDYNLEHIKFVDKPVDLGFPCPLDLHCKYLTDQVLAAMEFYTEEKKGYMMEGVKYLDEKNCELLFVTLNKSEKDYSPSTMYHDYAINEWLFHWQSQSTIADHTPTGQRYVNNDDENYTPLLFVRKYKKENGQTAPYHYLGPVQYKEHNGNNPINIVWELKNNMPPFVLKESNKFTIT